MKIFFYVCFAMLVISCTERNEENLTYVHEEKKHDTVTNENIIFKNFTVELYKNWESFRLYSENFEPLSRTDVTTIEEKDKRTEILSHGVMNEISKMSEVFLNDLNFTSDEIKKITQGEKEKIEDFTADEKSNLAMFAYTLFLTLSDEHVSTFSNVGYTLQNQITTRGIGKDLFESLYCFANLLGIDTTLLKSSFTLLRNYAGRTIKSLVIGVLTNVGFKAISGIGWAITIGQLAYCIYQQVYARSNYNCVYSIPIPSWWNLSMKIDPTEALSLPIVIYDYTGKLIYSQIPKEKIGKVKAVFRVAYLNSLIYKV